MKTPKSGLLRFQESLLKIADPHVKTVLASMRKGEQVAQPIDASFSSVLHGFFEITNTLDSLDLVESLAAIAPPRSRRIKKDEYLKFLIGAYLQEIYILEQRLTAYAKKMLRLHKAKSKIPDVVNEIEKAFGAIIKVRGAHVHEQRFSDQKLDSLSSIAFVSRFKPEFIDDAHLEYKLAQRDWLQTMRSNSIATCKFIDFYCDLLFAEMALSGQLGLSPYPLRKSHK